MSLGSWLTYGESVDETMTQRCVDAAFALGVNFFDTANGYAKGEAERVLGRALRSRNRDEFILATKWFFPTGTGPSARGLSRKHIFDACDASLRRLGLDSIDVYQCHRFDPDTPLLETIAAMTDLIRLGKIRYWGFSQWSAQQISEAVQIADANGLVRPLSDQARYNILDREIESGVMQACSAAGIGILAYSPLAQGVLTGKYVDGIPAGSRASNPAAAEGMKWRLTPEDRSRVQRLSAIAGDLGMDTATLALAWCLRMDVVATVITGARTPEQLQWNAKAARIDLTPETIHLIDGIA